MAAVSAPGIVVDASFPGGNVIVDGIEGDVVRMRQDLRDTQTDWFHWCFRVRGAAGRALRFEFTRGNVIGVRGPAVSADGGRSWSWLGTEAVDGTAFRYAFAPDAGEVRFGFAVPYLQPELERFLERHRGSPALEAGALCRTTKGRDAEQLRLGRLDGRAEHRVVLTARHHCCESMASYALEGMMESVLAGSGDGRWLRERVEFLVVPFVDKDGVEDGDQGKNRHPRDHNRDYAGESLYPTVAAIRDRVPRWSEGRLHFALDLHCPHIRGQSNERIYFVGGPDAENWRRVGIFSRMLEAVPADAGSLPYHAADNLPFGQGWNTRANHSAGKSFACWASELPGIRFASTIEIPYANAGGAAVIAGSARAFGHDLARALRRFLEAGE